MKVRRYVIMLTVTIVVVVVTFVGTLLSSNRPELGLDLQGGVSVVLFPVEGSDTSTLNTAADIIRNRVDALGIAEPDVSRQGDTIVIDLPGAKNRSQALDVIGKTAELRFRLVQQQIPPGVLNPPTTTAKPGATTTTKPGATTTTKPAATTTTVTGSGAAVPGRTITTEPIAVRRPAQEATTTTQAAATSTTGPSTTSTTLKPNSTCKDIVTPETKNRADAQVILLDREPEKNGCWALGPALLTGKSVKTARASYATDNSGSGWGVDVTFKNDDFVNKVATPNVGRQVAIELDGIVQSAPVINEGITGRTVRISGNFTQGEAKDLALVLKYGALPVQFDNDQTTSQSVSPTLGKDQLHAGIVAGVVGLALVALYMIAYYRLLGLVVWLGLLLTGMVFFSLISYLSNSRGLTLTLAGVTGIIVSVGVTVDSYVVYFERLKDEVRSGKTVRSSVESGFRRSFRTIVAADFVSLLGAAVLYELATGSVRGFAFFLGVSTAIDLVLAYFFMHPLVVLMARKPELVRMRGIGIASGLDVAGVQA